MKRKSRILVTWAAMIFLWACCIIMTCLYINDTICVEDERCIHADDVILPDNSRMMGPYKEIYDYMPIDEINEIVHQVSHKSIVLYTKFDGKSWGIPEGDSIFHQLSCSVKFCDVTEDITRAETSDVIVMHSSDIKSRDNLPNSKPTNQRWLLYMMEPPDMLQTNLSMLNGMMNWTSTYSTMSDIPVPFGGYTPHQDVFKTNVLEPHQSSGNSSETVTRNTNISILLNKSEIVAMFTKHCTLPTEHKQYIHELKKHVPVHLYGPCRHTSCGTRQQCLDMLRTKYKFYLSFEECNCHQYITDRFWHVALQHDVIPIVMGAPRSDYELVAPPHSFIHIHDYASPEYLAQHLNELDENPELYLKYFRWKSDGYVTDAKPINQDHNFWCELCSKLHSTKWMKTRQVYGHLDKWWSKHQQCHFKRTTYT